MLDEADLCAIHDLSRRLNEAIHSLPDTYREAFVMHRFRDMTYKEIAEQLDTTDQSVDYRIQQAVKLLSVELKDYLPLLAFLLAGKSCSPAAPGKNRPKIAPSPPPVPLTLPDAPALM